MSALLSPTFLRHPQVPYEEFIREKVAFDRSFGFEVDDADLSPVLLPHQRELDREQATPSLFDLLDMEAA